MRNINEFVKKPQLTQIVLDDEDTVNTFGDSVIFYMKDFVDVNTYFDFFRSQSENSNQLNEVLQRLILNDQGKPVLRDDETLPIELAVKVLTKINEILGKSKTKPLMKEVGTQSA